MGTTFEGESWNFVIANSQHLKPNLKHPYRFLCVVIYQYCCVKQIDPLHLMESLQSSLLVLAFSVFVPRKTKLNGDRDLELESFVDKMKD